MRKIKQKRRASVVAPSPRTALELKAEGSVWKIRDILPHKLQTSGDQRCTSYAFGRANGESKSASILGDLKNTWKQHLAISWWLETRTSLLSHGMSTNCWRKPTDTPWMLRISCACLLVFPAFLKIVIGRCSAVLSYLNVRKSWIAPCFVSVLKPVKASCKTVRVQVRLAVTHLLTYVDSVLRTKGKRLTGYKCKRAWSTEPLHSLDIEIEITGFRHNIPWQSVAYLCKMAPMAKLKYASFLIIY